jgi:uncharacterized membrane protein YuzA (DUF378 family)
MKRIILNLIAAFTLIFIPLIAIPALASADCGTPSDSKTQVLKGISQTGSDCSSNGVSNFISTIVSILSYIVGIAAIIVIILSGMKYITSGGDSGKVASAKNTLIYALIGIAIAALAQFLVHFVFTAATSRSCSSGHHLSADGQTCIKN